MHMFLTCTCMYIIMHVLTMTQGMFLSEIRNEKPCLHLTEQLSRQENAKNTKKKRELLVTMATLLTIATDTMVVMMTSSTDIERGRVM